MKKKLRFGGKRYFYWLGFNDVKNIKLHFHYNARWPIWAKKYYYHGRHDATLTFIDPRVNHERF